MISKNLAPELDENEEATESEDIKNTPSEDNPITVLFF